MSRNASGTYTLPAGNPVSSGTTISSTWANDTMDDLETEMTASLDRNGKGGMLAALRGVDGSVSAPAYSWTSETNTGFYRISSGSIGFAIGGTKTITLDSTGMDVDGTVTVDKLVVNNEIVESNTTMTGTTPALNPTGGTVKTWTLTAESTPTDDMADGEFLTILIDTPSYAVVWTNVDEWVGGTAPVLDTSNTNVVEIWKVGTSLYGAFVGVLS